MVSNALPAVGTHIDYEYDFGDGWDHRITVEQVFDHNPNSNGTFCRVTDGRRVCPPEDCGGAPGYENLLEALNDPNYEEHAELSEWMAEQMGYELPFDSARFNVQEANEALNNLSK